MQKKMALPLVQSNPRTTKKRLIKVALLCALVIVIDSILPAMEDSLVASPESTQGVFINYFVPYSGGEMSWCLKTPWVSSDYKEGSILLLKKSRILGVCSVSSLPQNWVKPEFGSWRSMEK